MSRHYVGVGYSEPTRYDVHVEEDGKSYSFRQHAGPADIDFSWDAAGPGSNDLARALLWASTGVEPSWSMYRLFKAEVVSTWPKHKGECWRISDEEIGEWLASVERDTVATEDAGRTETRLKQTKAREVKVQGFTNTFKRQG